MYNLMIVIFIIFYTISLTIYFKELIIESSTWNNYFRNKVIMFIVFSIIGLIPIINLYAGISAHKERTKGC